MMHTPDSLEAVCRTRGTTPRGGAASAKPSSKRSHGAGTVTLVLSRPLSLTTRSHIVATLVSFGIRATFKAFALGATPAPSKPRRTTPRPKQGRTGGLCPVPSRGRRCYHGKRPGDCFRCDVQGSL